MISPTPLEQLNGVWKHEARHQGNWYVSIKVVSLKLSSQRGHSSFRRMYAGKHTAHRCDSFPWLSPRTCLQAITHKSTVALKKKKQKKNPTTTKKPVRPFPSPHYNCQYMASLSKSRQVTPFLKRGNISSDF